jgi:hypothetical protein
LSFFGACASEAAGAAAASPAAFRNERRFRFFSLTQLDEGRA